MEDEILDILLDQEGLEIDELDRMEKDTPLHKAVRYSNQLSPEEREAGHAVVDILIDAGCDPRLEVFHDSKEQSDAEVRTFSDVL